MHHGGKLVPPTAQPLEKISTTVSPAITTTPPPSRSATTPKGNQLADSTTTQVRAAVADLVSAWNSSSSTTAGPFQNTNNICFLTRKQSTCFPHRWSQTNCGSQTC
ncbi:hypothetical protein I3842_10G099200 [Carya illinoinensis]|uniref:Uncharacterized protein n=1 Tax=Carya illinoinensis TaxID=32201 RepID=A0A922J3S0_CARIL|nr:hypothetical protein I3842_10G099200 [Carya illinoinensis]